MGVLLEWSKVTWNIGWLVVCNTRLFACLHRGSACLRGVCGAHAPHRIGAGPTHTGVKSNAGISSSGHGLCTRCTSSGSANAKGAVENSTARSALITAARELPVQHELELA